MADWSGVSVDARRLPGPGAVRLLRRNVVAADSVLALAAASMSGAAISSSEGSATRSPAFRLRDAIGCDRGGPVFGSATKTAAAYPVSGTAAVWPLRPPAE